MKISFSSLFFNCYYYFRCFRSPSHHPTVLSVAVRCFYRRNWGAIDSCLTKSAKPNIRVQCSETSKRQVLQQGTRKHDSIYLFAPSSPYTPRVFSASVIFQGFFSFAAFIIFVRSKIVSLLYKDQSFYSTRITITGKESDSYKRSCSGCTLALYSPNFDRTPSAICFLLAILTIWSAANTALTAVTNAIEKLRRILPATAGFVFMLIDFLWTV